jgi:carbonic anhydrase/acetyltransferase-like protein (isoleucine patch superfamily)
MATLIGDGGHAQDIAQTRLFDRVLANHADFEDDGGSVIIGINDPWMRYMIRRAIGVTDSSWVHPHAHLGPDCKVGVGTHINYGVTMTRTQIGSHVTVSPGVTICGDVVIGDRVLIGAGATICEKVYIADDVIIGAGAVVTPGCWGDNREIEYNHIPSGTTWVGVPARQK